MHKLFVIFAVTTGYFKSIAIILGIIFVLFILITSAWIYIDYQEIYLRNQVLAQQEIVHITHNLEEQRKLIDYKREYDTLRECWIGELLLSSRPVINITTH